MLRSLAWWVVIVVFGLTASWWLPKLTGPVAPASQAAPGVVGADSDLVLVGYLDPDCDDTGGLGDPFGVPGKPLCPIDPASVPQLPDSQDGGSGVIGWVQSQVSGAVKDMSEAIGRQTLILRPEALEIMDPDDPSGFDSLSRGIARVGIILLITISGIRVMTNNSLASVYTVRQLAPRIVIGYIGMELSVRVLSFIVTHTNFLIDAILSVGFTGVTPDEISATISGAIENTFAGQSWVAVTLAVGMLIMLTLALLGMVSRMLLLTLLAVTGPIALACYALPAAEGITRIWWRALGACVASGIGQALVLVLWFRLFFNGDTQRPSVFHVHDAISRYADMLLIMAFLWLMHKAVAIPMKTAFAPLGGSPITPVIRIVTGLLSAKTFGLIGRAGSAGASAATSTAKSAVPGAKVKGPTRHLPLEHPAAGDAHGPVLAPPRRHRTSDDPAPTKDAPRPARKQHRPARTARTDAAPPARRQAPGRPRTPRTPDAPGVPASRGSGVGFVAHRPFLPAYRQPRTADPNLPPPPPRQRLRRPATPPPMPPPPRAPRRRPGGNEQTGARPW